MNTRQRVNTRSSFGTPREGGKQPGPSTLTPSGMKSEPLISQINPPASISNSGTSFNPTSSPIPRGLMTRDGTPASSTTRLSSDLRINPLRSAAATTPGTRAGTRAVQPVSSVTRGGAAKRTFKPKLPAISDTRKNDNNVQTKAVDQVLEESVSRSDQDKSRRSPSRRNGTIDTRSKKQIVQMESSVFTGSGVLKPVRGTKASSAISFGLSSATGTVTSVSRVASKEEATGTVASVSKVASKVEDLKAKAKVSRDGYESDDFIASDDESEESFGGKKNTLPSDQLVYDSLHSASIKRHSTTIPIGHDSLHSASTKGQGTKLVTKIKQEKDQDLGTEFNESFLIKPASDVFMKFLSLQQVNHDKSMMMIQVPESLIKTESVKTESLKTESVKNPEAESSNDSDSVIDNYVGRLRMYQSGRVEIVKPDGSVFEVTRTGNENISVPSDLQRSCSKPRVVNPKNMSCNQMLERRWFKAVVSVQSIKL